MKRLALCALALVPAGCYVVEERQYHPGNQPLTNEEVISLTKEGASERSILNRIAQGGVERKPTADDLVRFQEAGVSSRVMAGMIDAPVRRRTPGFETRTYRYARNPFAEDLFLYGAGILTGYLIWRHYH